MKLLLFVAALPFGLFATSSVTIRSGPAYRAIIHPEDDCHFDDKTIAAIRIERALLDEAGKENGRAVVGSCSKTKFTEDYWFYTLDERGKIQGKRNTSIRLDNSGRIIEEADRTWDDDGQESVMRYQTTYDSRGRSLEDRVIDDDGETNPSRYTYDEGGDQVAITEFDKEGKVTSVTKFRYNDQHHLIAKFTQDGVVTSYRYDAQGQLDEESSNAGGQQNTVLYAYDEQGRPLSKRSLLGPSREVIWVNGFSYWPNGLIKDEWLIRPPTALPPYDLPGLTLEHYAYDEHDHLTQEWTYSETRGALPKKFLFWSMVAWKRLAQAIACAHSRTRTTLMAIGSKP